MYLHFDDYEAYGGTADELSFDRVNYRVTKLIDSLTHMRIKHEEPARESVKRLAFELFELEMERAASNQPTGVSSVSNDGVSVSYMGGNDAAESYNARVKALSATYLADETDDNGVCLLYAGRFE